MEDARVSLVGKGQQRSRAGLWSPKTRVRGSMSRAATAIIYKNLRKSLFAVSIFPGQAHPGIPCIFSSRIIIHQTLVPAKDLYKECPNNSGFWLLASDRKRLQYSAFYR
jgi:hypothetical protein